MKLKHVIAAVPLLSVAALLNTQAKADDLSYSDGVLVLTPTSHYKTVCRCSMW